MFTIASIMFTIDSIIITYNPAVPIEMFDHIVTISPARKSPPRSASRAPATPTARRWQLEYFDALLIGLTATPSKQTIGFFNQNLVMEYNHERAVTGQGGKVEQGFYADRRTA